MPDFRPTDTGRRVERFGGARAEIAVRGRTVDLTWRTEAGTVVKSAPTRVRAEFAGGVKELKADVADIEKMIPAQAQRLERLFLARRSWEFARWAEGTYLCIVPAPRAQDPLADVPLPFEGDQLLGIILSKAMLLANDANITDPAITSQLGDQAGPPGQLS